MWVSLGIKLRCSIHPLPSFKKLHMREARQEDTTMGAGTNVIESEAVRLVKERLSGPTGHRLLVDMKMEIEPGQPDTGEDE